MLYLKSLLIVFACVSPFIYSYFTICTHRYKLDNKILSVGGRLNNKVDTHNPYM